jgi:mannose/cellobiose epimerase-like protein (N-acyl-D-glucosamine 2-epimerase family)
MAEELQEQLLAWEEELSRREEALATQDEKVRIYENSLTKFSADLDAKQAKAEATRKEYLDKMEVHTNRTKHPLGLDKMLQEKKVELDGRERDPSLCEAMLAEAQSQRQNPQDNREELMEFVELRRLLQDAKVDRVAEAKR